MRRVLILLVLCGTSYGADIYFAQAAAGGNTGVNCANAFAVTSASWASSFSPGNKQHLCGLITSALTAGGSGAIGNVDTIFFETGAAWNIGVCPSSGCLSGTNKAYVVVDGGVTCGWVNQTLVPCNGKILPTASGTAFGNGATSSFTMDFTNCSNCEIRNLEISTYVAAQNDAKPPGDFRGINQGGISTANATFHVHNMIIHDTSSAISFVPGSLNDSGFEYDHNYIYNINSGSDISNNGNGTVTAAKLHDNEYGSTAAWDEPGCGSHHNSLHSFAYSDSRNGSWPYVITSASESGTTATVVMGGPDWQAAHTYIAQTIITPLLNNAGGYSYRAGSSGTSGAVGHEPNWALSAGSPGSDLFDGSITWQNIGAQDTTRMANGAPVIILNSNAGYNTPIGSVSTPLTILSSTSFSYTAATSGLGNSTTGNIVTHWNAGVQFYNNTVTGNWGGCPTSEIFYEGSGSYNVNGAIYGNLFNATYTQENNGVVSVTGLGKFLFANNTIIGDYQPSDGCMQLGTLSNSAWTVYDNIISSCHQPFSSNDTVTAFQANVVAMDFDTWGGTAGSPWGLNCGGGCTYYNTLTAWQATGYDANSNWTNNNTYVAVNSNGTLQSGSPAIGVGKNLTSTSCVTYPALCTDQAGTLRPTSGAWDDGAFVFVSGVVAPTVTTTTASGITATTATAGGTVTSNGGGSITSEGTCYALTANPTSPCTSDGTASPFASSLTGLTPNTTYNYRAFATNSAGISYGSNLTFTTPGVTFNMTMKKVTLNKVQIP